MDFSVLQAHWDGWNTIEGRHLVFAYVFVLLLQGGYFLWIVRGWAKLDAERRGRVRLDQAGSGKKAAKPM
jgi:hypothetical protein